MEITKDFKGKLTLIPRNSNFIYTKPFLKSSNMDYLSSIIPDRIGYFEKNFDKEKCLGKGGFSEVYLVIENNTRKKYAAKVLNRINSEEEINYLINEIKINKLLNHPNIIQFYDVFFDDEYTAIILSELGECDLYQEMKSKAYSQKMRADKLYSYSETIYILECVCSALKFAELMKIYHGDIKPQNVIKVKDKYKLADWGVSIQCENSLNKTQPVRIAGISKKYSAPEIIKVLQDYRENKNFIINPSKCDIYSLGVLIFEIFFQGVHNHNSLKSKYITKTIHSSMESDYYPQKFCSLILNMTNIDRNKRPSLDEIITFIEEEKNGKLTLFAIEESSKTNESDSDEGGTTSIKWNETKNNPEVKNEELEPPEEDDDKTIRKSVGINNEYEKTNLKNHIIREGVGIKNKYSMISYNEFFDFSLEIELIKKLKTYKKITVVSVSGRSFLGKSFNLNIILSIIANKLPENGQIPFLKVFETGNGVIGKTNGIDAYIYDLTNKKALLFLDVQGNNDKRKGHNWEFLYLCLFYMAFTISDYHFIFYSENTEDLENSQIRTVLEMKKKSKLHSKNTEIICCFREHSSGIAGEMLETKINEHSKISKDIFGEYVKNKTYFLKDNWHFDMQYCKDSCLKTEEKYICSKCDTSEVMISLKKISNYILETDNFHNGRKICRGLNRVRIDAENQRLRLWKNFYGSTDFASELTKHYYETNINLASKFDVFTVYDILIMLNDKWKILTGEIKIAAKIALILTKIRIATKSAVSFISEELDGNHNLDNFNFIFFKIQFLNNLTKYVIEMDLEIKITENYKQQEQEGNLLIKLELLKELNLKNIGKIEEERRKRFSFFPIFFFPKKVNVYKLDKQCISKILKKSDLLNEGEYSENENFCIFFMKNFEVLMIKNFHNAYKKYKEMIIKNQKNTDKKIIELESLFSSRRLDNIGKIKVLTDLQNLLDESLCLFKEVLEIEI